jgi:hypothetical protein
MILYLKNEKILSFLKKNNKLGERIDVIINANQEPKDYWIKVRGDGICGLNKVHQRAVLKYERNDYALNKLDSSITFSFEDTFRQGKVLNRFYLLEMLFSFLNYFFFL